MTIDVQGPALLAARTAITDFAGNYRVGNLPSGTYTVTFTLPGFATVVREGIVLEGAFVAEVDAELAVGGVEETITVTGETPLVDVKSTKQQSVLSAERVNVLPAAAGLFSAAQYVPGATRDGAFSNLPTLHGSEATDSQPAVDGIKSGAQLQGEGSYPGGVGTVTNEAMVAEIVFDVGTQTAEFAQSGLRTNVAPKAGGNTFAGNVFANGTNQSFQSDNQSQELKDRGFQFAPTDYSWSVNPAIGGPIIEDKLWFFASMYESRSRSFILDAFFDPSEPSTPEGLGDDLRAFGTGESGRYSVRVTHQVTQRNKATYSFESQKNASTRNAWVFDGSPNSPEGYYNFNSDPTYMVTGRWTAPLTNRLLVEVDGAYQKTDVNTQPMDHGGEFRVAYKDFLTGNRFNSSSQNHNNRDWHRRANASLSYVTGSHNFKTGLNWANNSTGLALPGAGDMFEAYLFAGFPLGVLVTGNGTVRNGIDQNCDCGIFVQDAWTMDRLTLNGGLRYDWFNNSVPGGFRPAGFWAPELTLPDPLVEDTPDWKNFNGRVGGAFDLFGDGQTAVKAAAGRYVANQGTGVTQGFSPIYPYSNLDFRTWTDLDQNGSPLDPATGVPQFAEIGPSANPNFGTSTVQTQLDPDLRRRTNWEYSAGIEHQLGNGWAISGMWHRRSYTNYEWTDNRNTNAGDWSLAGTFTGPTSSMLPDSAQGVQIPIYVTDPDFEIQGGNDLLTRAEENWRTWNGFEVILDGELPRGGFMTASFTAGKSTDHFCHRGMVQAPNDLFQCETTSPYRPMGKLSGALPLPWDTMISGLFQVFAGRDLRATYTITDVDFPGLNLGDPDDATPTMIVDLIELGTEFEDYTTNLQIRFSKTFQTGFLRTRIYMDANNIFNQARVTSRNRNFGGGGIQNPAFDRLLAIESGRRLFFGVQTYF